MSSCTTSMCQTNEKKGILLAFLGRLFQAFYYAHIVESLELARPLSEIEQRIRNLWIITRDLYTFNNFINKGLNY